MAFLVASFELTLRPHFDRALNCPITDLCVEFASKRGRSIDHWTDSNAVEDLYIFPSSLRRNIHKFHYGSHRKPKEAKFLPASGSYSREEAFRRDFR